MAAGGLVNVDDLSGTLDLSRKNSANPTATGGTAKTGLVINTSSAGGSFGVVKMLAFAGVGLLIYRLWRSKK